MFHIVIPSEKRAVVTISGNVSPARIEQIAAWEIENNNGTGKCTLSLHAFECVVTMDPLMDVELTIDYTSVQVLSGCGYQPITLELEYLSERHVFLQDVYEAEPYCILLPLLAR